MRWKDYLYLGLALVCTSGTSKEYDEKKNPNKIINMWKEKVKSVINLQLISKNLNLMYGEDYCQMLMS